MPYKVYMRKTACRMVLKCDGWSRLSPRLIYFGDSSHRISAFFSYILCKAWWWWDLNIHHSHYY